MVNDPSLIRLAVAGDNTNRMGINTDVRCRFHLKLPVRSLRVIGHYLFTGPKRPKGQIATSGGTLPENGGFARVQGERGVFSRGKTCGLTGPRGRFFGNNEVFGLT